MKILSAEFIRSCYETGQFPRDRLAEVAFVGRSNVGKSALINSLLNRKHLAKVSRSPGKTRAINYFRVAIGRRNREDLYVVDLPGYGYAKVSKSVRAEWGPMIESYLTGRPELRGVVFLVDARRAEAQDRSTVEWLSLMGLKSLVVATKVDKLSRSERARTLGALKEGLGLPADATVIPYSSPTHEGREALWRELTSLLS